MLAERMAAGVASGVYQVEHMAAVTFTRKAASELRGRFHLALERLLSAGHARGVRLEPEEDARVRAALSNLERFFAGTIHSFCARLLRERPVESGVSPGFTELDEVQDLELRHRAWRDFITNMRSAGDPDMLALLDAGVRPKDLDSAFATICGNEDVEFPPGERRVSGSEAGVEGAGEVLEGAAEAAAGALDASTTCEIQKAARQFRGQLRVARRKLERPAAIAELLDTWDCESTIVQKWWAGSTAEKKRLKADIERLHGDFCARSSRRIWRSGGSTSIASRSPCSRAPATSPRTSAAAGTRSTTATC